MSESPDIDIPDARAKVKDVEETNQASRLRGVHEAWRDTLERRTLAVDYGDSEEARRIYRAGVERVLIEIESVARRADANDAWDNKTLGTITLPVPTEIQRAYQDDSLRIKQKSQPPENAEYNVIGLKSILEVEWPVSETWTLTVSRTGGRTETISATSSTEPPMRVLDAAVRQIRSLLGAVGLDLELGGDYQAIGEKDRL